MQNRVQQIYLDTSVIGGYFDTDFEEDTQILFEKIQLGQFHVIYSNITEDELIGAPKKVKDVISGIPDRLKTRIELSPEAVQLADAYILENVVGKTSRADCSILLWQRFVKSIFW